LSTSSQKLGLSEKPIEALEIKNRTAPNKNQNAIEARGLNKTFGDFSAVQDVSVNIAYGEIYGLLGANGAGKTTTIKMLCGLLRPDSGTITLGGENSQLRSTNLRRKIGYMSQKFTLYDGLTVKENLEFYCGIYEIPVNDRQRRIQWAIKTADMAGKENRLVGQLPFGWKQRVAFVSALMHQPEILFLDEPTAGVDPVARRQLWAMIKKMAQDGTAVLVTTHYMDEAEYCNRLSFMSDSRLIVEGSPHEIRQKGKAIKSQDEGLDDSLDAAFIKLVGQARRAEGGNYADK
jgi:ABC-2 type transport system ATP-binding protein